MSPAVKANQSLSSEVAAFLSGDSSVIKEHSDHTNAKHQRHINKNHDVHVNHLTMKQRRKLHKNKNNDTITPNNQLKRGVVKNKPTSSNKPKQHSNEKSHQTVNRMGNQNVDTAITAAVKDGRKTHKKRPAAGSGGDRATHDIKHVVDRIGDTSATINHSQSDSDVDVVIDTDSGTRESAADTGSSPSASTIHHEPTLYGEIEKWYKHPSFKKAEEFMLSLPSSKHPLLTSVEHDNNLKYARMRVEELFKELDEKMKDSQYNNSHDDGRWMSTIMQKGTLSDRIPAIQLMIQESPVHRLDHLNRLMSMAAKKGRREQSLAIDALKELFLHDLLPHNRHLKSFHSQPVFKYIDLKSSFNANDNIVNNQTLMYMMLEDQLKIRYTRFIELLNEGARDNLLYIRKQRLQSIYDLLVKCPEQEQQLLSILINKLGDPNKQIASKSLYLLTTILQHHPAMKVNIVNEIEHFLFRSHITPKAQYYALIYLNQIMFTQNDPELATRMINIYFTLFQVNIKNLTPSSRRDHANGGGDVEQGVDDVQVDSDDDESGMKGTKKKNKSMQPHLSKTHAAKRKLMTLRAMSKQQNVAVSTKLLSTILTGINRALPYSKLSVSGNVDADEDGTKSEFERHIEKLFGVIHAPVFNVALQALMLLFQVISVDADMMTESSLTDRFYRAFYDKLSSSDIWHSTHKHAMLLNLLYKALKYDTNMRRVASFVRRIIQQTLYHQPPFVTAVLYLVSQLFALPSHASLQCMLRTAVNAYSEDDEVELYTDATESGDSNNVASSKSFEVVSSQQNKEDADKPNRGYRNHDDTADGTIKHEENGGRAVKEDGITGVAVCSMRYDARKRDPKYSNAYGSSAWEVALLTCHYHPSVLAFAKQLAECRASIVYEGDPLLDFTSTSFLDKFSYRNPKQVDSTRRHGARIQLHARRIHALSGTRTTPVNTPEWLEKYQSHSSDIPADQRFFYRYFNEKAKRSSVSASGSGPKGVDIDGLDIDEYADKVMEDEIARDSFVNDADVDLDEFQDDEELARDEGDDEDEDAVDEAVDGAEDDEISEGELAAAREAFGDHDDEGLDSDEDVGEDEDDFDFQEEFMDEEDAEASESELAATTSSSAAAVGSGRKCDRSKTDAAIFASAEDFAELLNEGGDGTLSSSAMKKLSQWQEGPHRQKGSTSINANKHRSVSGNTNRKNKRAKC